MFALSLRGGGSSASRCLSLAQRVLKALNSVTSGGPVAPALRGGQKRVIPGGWAGEDQCLPRSHCCIWGFAFCQRCG